MAPTALLALASLLFTGCVTGRRSFDVPVAAASVGQSPAAKGTYSFAQVTDDRVFENHPSDPSTPSINGDVNDLSAEARDRFIGRQRNGFGHAMGDIVLPEGKTVQSKVEELLGQGLRAHGYVPAASGPGDLSLDVKVQQFWSWITPGFFALSFEARLRCEVDVRHDGTTKVLDVRGYALNHGQFAKNKNWQEAYEEAFADFLKDFDHQLTVNGY
jgi:uncharacterized lipoprotein YajG